jgi:hypothetical protein
VPTLSSSDMPLRAWRRLAHRTGVVIAVEQAMEWLCAGSTCATGEGTIF